MGTIVMCEKGGLHGSYHRNAWRRQKGGGQQLVIDAFFDERFLERRQPCEFLVGAQPQQWKRIKSGRQVTLQWA